MREDDDFPTIIKQIVDAKGINIRYFIDLMREEALKNSQEGKIDTLVISSEMLCFSAPDEPFVKLKNFLETMGDDIEIIAYVRNPADYYLSSMQQNMKHTQAPIPPAEVSYKKFLAPYERVFGKRLSLINYDAVRKEKGDILKSFFARFFPAIDENEIAPFSSSTNETLSAEGMALMRTYRGLFHADADQLIKSDAVLVIEKIKKADRRIGMKRPALFPEIHDKINHGSPDLLWLRDAYGIVFDGIDYGRIGAPLAAQQGLALEAIVPIDAERKMHLAMEVLHLFVHERSTPPTPPILVKNPPRFSLFDYFPFRRMR